MSRYAILHKVSALVRQCKADHGREAMTCIINATKTFGGFQNSYS